MANWHIKGDLKREAFINIDEEVEAETEEEALLLAIEKTNETPYHAENTWSDGPYVFCTDEEE